ncbi:hypothetical protein F7731_18160 [Cytobacillus depressus]|uniref:Ethanolamine utilization protein n=1 Tax=Cytobacillus depressus TaxID=1602942 RepID=A0A6L3V376_9BACI|nr:hypothetical protein [Cytobacillus depressus]KAB2331518.1 hypothetical protein F7731_18160 [Cytobacillus depressus]
MSSNRQSVMAANTLHELSNRNSNGKSLQKRPYVLALLTSHLIGMEPGLLYLQRLIHQPFIIRMAAEESLFEYFSKNKLIELTCNDDWIQSQQLLVNNQADIIFLPILSFSLAADILSLNEQRPYVRLILQSLLKGKKVVGLKLGIDPHHQLWRLEGMDQSSLHVKRKLHDQMAQLKAMGIQLIHEEDSIQPLKNNPTKKTIVTAETIRYLQQTGQQVINIREKAIITPLAHDLAKELKIELIID